MLTLKLQAKDYELTILPPPPKLKTDPYPKQSQDQSLFQAEHFRLKSCFDQILGGLNFCRPHFLDKISMDPKNFWTQKFFGPNISLNQYFSENIFLAKFFGPGDF